MEDEEQNNWTTHPLYHIAIIINLIMTAIYTDSIKMNINFSNIESPEMQCSCLPSD